MAPDEGCGRAGRRCCCAPGHGRPPGPRAAPPRPRRATRLPPHGHLARLHHGPSGPSRACAHSTTSGPCRAPPRQPAAPVVGHRPPRGAATAPSAGISTLWVLCRSRRRSLQLHADNIERHPSSLSGLAMLLLERERVDCLDSRKQVDARSRAGQPDRFDAPTLRKQITNLRGKRFRKQHCQFRLHVTLTSAVESKHVLSLGLPSRRVTEPVAAQHLEDLVALGLRKRVGGVGNGARCAGTTGCCARSGARQRQDRGGVDPAGRAGRAVVRARAATRRRREASRR